MHGLGTEYQRLRRMQERVRASRSADHRNTEGGDADHGWDQGLVVRHAVNYFLAVQSARAVSAPGPILDVGAGAGAFSVWAAELLSRPLHLCDTDAGHRALARRAFPAVPVHADIEAAPPAAVVLGMEVIEHVRPSQQEPFVRSLVERARPGGVVVLSTPDESGYWGGWSGYPPHIGPLDAHALAAVVQRATGLEPTVLRIGGPGFRLGRLERWTLPVVNRLWGSVADRAPRLVGTVEGAVGRLGDRWGSEPTIHEDAYQLVDARGSGAEQGTGMLALVRLPA